MPITYLKWISRPLVQANRESRFVFGDNTLRQGYGGQAKSMRGEPNAIGVATKWAPGMRDMDFFSDRDRVERAIEIITGDLSRVDFALKDGRTVYVPADGIGTGLSQMPERAPKLYSIIYEFFRTRSAPGAFIWPRAA